VKLLAAALLALWARGAPVDALGPLAASPGEEGFTALERAEIEQGRIVARVVDTDDHSEVMTIGAVRVRASKERFRECARDPSCLRRSDNLVGAGRLGTPPSPHDLKELNFDRKELEHLRECRVGDCEVRFSADAIERFRKEVDWSSPAAAERAAGLFRETLAGYASSYQAGGNRALPVYRDGKSATPPPASVQALLERPWFILTDVPELRRYLLDFPQARPDAAEDFVSWYEERAHRSSVIAVNHNTIYEKTDGSLSRIFVASKQLYASHYYESSVEVMAFVSGAAGDGGTLLFLGRARADIRPAGFHWFERVLLRRIVRWRLMARLRDAKEKLESASSFRAALP
jgi:hypothetical protein